MSRKSLLLSVVLFIQLFLMKREVCAASFLPDTGRVSLHQKLLDLEGNFNVLSVAIRPGCEDMTLLAYLRLGRGARIFSAYVTNGESGENDLAPQDPLGVAETRRHEAVRAVSMLDGEVRFLNMPDLGGVASTDDVLAGWDRDSLHARVERLISSSKPDLVVLVADPATGVNDPTFQFLKVELAKLFGKTDGTSAAREGHWTVKRCIATSPGKGSPSVPGDRVHPFWKLSFKEIGKEVASSYRSMSVQQADWGARSGSYEIVSGHHERLPRWIDDGLPGRRSKNLGWLDSEIAKLMRSENRVLKSPRSYLTKIAQLLDSIDAKLLHRWMLGNAEQRDLINWRGGLEALRASLLGVKVQYAFSESILTERQLLFFTLDTLVGTNKGGETQLFVPGVDQGWILDESPSSKVPCRFHEPYRLVSPQRVEYDLPFAQHGIQRTTDGTTFYIFIIHKAAKREESFVVRITQRFLFSPRLTVEVNPTIVRVTPGEHVTVRITNQSRDGVKDTLAVRDSMASSEPSVFRLNSKGSSSTHTLALAWSKDIPEGTYIVPVSISDVTVGAFAARKFGVSIDTTMHVAVISQYDESPVIDALRRMEMQHVRVVSVDGVDAVQLRGCNVAILDHRALSFSRNQDSFVRMLTDFVEGGGRLVVLSQDDGPWNHSGFSSLFRLSHNHAIAPQHPVVFDTTAQFQSTPNHLSPIDLDGWIFRRAYNRIESSSSASSRVLAYSDFDGNPFIVSYFRGKGNLVYVSLALEPQLMNINPGAFRIIANLLAYGE